MRFLDTVPFAARGIVHTAMGVSNGVLVAAYAGGEGIATWAVAASWHAVLVPLTEAVVDAGAAPIAAARGRGDAAAVARLTGQAVLVGLAISLLLLLAGVAAVLALGGPAEVAARSVSNTLTPASFLAVMLVTDSVGAAADGVRAALLGRGMGGRSATGGAAGKALQLLLGWILIPRLGLLGVLGAYAIAQVAETAIQAVQGWEFRRDIRLSAVRVAEVAAQFRFGAASAMADASRNLLYAVCVGEVSASCGVPGLVLHTALVKVSNLHFKALGSIGGGARAEIASGLAAGQGLWGILRPTAGAMVAWGVVFSAVYAAIPQASWEVLAPGVEMATVWAAVAVLAGTMPVEIASALGNAYLRAIQHARALMVCEAAGALTMVGAGTLALRFGWGVPGLWVAFALDASVCAAVAWVVARETRK
jgi:Na+-driven multidrug efflux pump